MKRPIVEILREHNLTYMQNGKEMVNHIEEKGVKRIKRILTRVEVPLSLEIEEGYEDLGVIMLIDPDGVKHEGFKRPKGKALGMKICEIMFDHNSKSIWRDIDKHIEELKQRVYKGILLSVCKHHIDTNNRITIGVEWMGHICYVKGYLMC